MIEILEEWLSRGWLRPLDLALAQFLADEAQPHDPLLLLTIALVSHQLGRGHVCLDLERTLVDPGATLALPPEGTPNDPLGPGPLLAGLHLAEWIRHLDLPDLVGSGAGNTPLVRSANRLYLRRYWNYERAVELGIRERLAPHPDPFDPAGIRQALAERFPPLANGRTDWQKIACAVALQGRFTIITGGPGTGKTSTVVQLIGLLQHLTEQRKNAPLRIRLTAPTGKAAARLMESLGRTEGHPPDEVITLHRLLGARHDSRHFRHDAAHPLGLDLLVIDEASMVDLELMAAVLAALPPSARLILLGDKDQLASVEAGSVLGELCREADLGHYWSATLQAIAALSGETLDPRFQDPDGRDLDQRIVMLRDSRRFDSVGGIGQLAQAINRADPPLIRTALAPMKGELRVHDLPTIDDPRLERLILSPPDEPDTPDTPAGLTDYLRLIARGMPNDNDPATLDRWAAQVLAARGRCQLLCGVRAGPFGVAALNRRIEGALRRQGLIAGDGEWYEGRPVMVTRNDYALGLMNGDIGIALRHPTPDGLWTLRVAFARSGQPGAIRWLLPSRLSRAETVYALTVHKAQGSEFDHTLLLLPPEPSAALSRELVYTAITRGRRWVTLIRIGDPELIEKAAACTVQRSGGLFDKN